uniref:Ig-like domain-containing protein n=1 Tax=Malurus cyaneus samueli TaxID=2593467 RepID=A0A8C5T5L2_9PASS
MVRIFSALTQRMPAGTSPRTPTCHGMSGQFSRTAPLVSELRPVATVFTHTPSLDQLLFVCHVTGFYPHPISVAWLQDGHEVPLDPVLNSSTILPNADLTYQLHSLLAMAPRDGHSYVCRVRHRSLGTRSLLIPWGRCYPWG